MGRQRRLIGRWMVWVWVACAACSKPPAATKMAKSAAESSDKEQQSTAESDREKPEKSAVPQGVTLHEVTLGDMHKVVLARGVVEVPEERRKTTKADDSGRLGRTTAGNWPRLGMAVVPCQPLLQVSRRTPQTATQQSQARQLHRRCWTAHQGRSPNAKPWPQPNPMTDVVYADCAGRVIAVHKPVGGVVERGDALVTVGCDGDLELRITDRTDGGSLPTRVIDAWLLDPSGTPPERLTEPMPGAALSWWLPPDSALAVHGNHVDVALDVGGGRPAITLPTHALDIGEGRAVVYVWKAEKGAVPRKIIVGATNPVSTEVVGGLQVGEWVVTSGFSQVGVERAPVGK